MEIKDIVLILILLYILFWIFYIKYDNFSIYPYNSNDIAEISKTELEIQTEQINELLTKEFSDKEEYNPYKVNTSLFKEIPFFENFIYEKDLKKIFIKKLSSSLLPKFPDLDLISTSQLKNIKYKDISLDRHFILNIIVTSKKYSFTREFICYFIINNINNYLLDSGEYIPIANLKTQDVIFKYITETKIENTKVLLPKPLLNYYEIKNKLFLLDPFLTSGKEMQITKESQDTFLKVLQEKEEKLELYSQGNCYDTNNKVLFSDKNTYENIIKCENDPLNKWDTIPFSDYDCPFYEKNKNYPNNFGGFKNNSCEMPLNIKQQGYRFFSSEPQNKPLCYNCKTDKINNGSLGKCCDKQLNKEDYPELLTPDYAFPNDNLLRKKYNDIFQEKKLNID